MPPPPNTSPLSPSFLWYSARNPPSDPSTSFAGRTVLITGASSGLGFEAALKFASLGASRLIFGVRSVQRGEAARRQICSRVPGGYREEDVGVYQLNMASFEGVTGFVEEVVRKEGTRGVDAVVLNAGIAASGWGLSEEGYEMSVQVNGLSTALVGLGLLPVLRETARRRGRAAGLEIVGSTGHFMVGEADVRFGEDAKVLEEISREGYFRLQRQYCLTKLLNMYVQDGLVEVQEKHGGVDEVIITVVCPGLSRSGIAREAPWYQRWADEVFKQMLARTGEQGSRSIVSGAALGKDAHGAFWAHDVLFRKGELCTSEFGKNLSQRVWAEMVEVLQNKAGLGPL